MEEEGGEEEDVARRGTMGLAPQPVLAEHLVERLVVVDGEVIPLGRRLARALLPRVLLVRVRVRARVRVRVRVRDRVRLGLGLGLGC